MIFAPLLSTPVKSGAFLPTSGADAAAGTETSNAAAKTAAVRVMKRSVIGLLLISRIAFPAATAGRQSPDRSARLVSSAMLRIAAIVPPSVRICGSTMGFFCDPFGG